MKKSLNILGDPSLKLKYDAPTSIHEAQNEIVSGFELLQNYPNPFNPTTKIKYVVGDAYYASQAHVLLRVYDVLGNEVVTLVNEQKPASTYEVEFNASQLSSGVYFYKLQAGNIIETKKMILLR
ncbi:MAG: T9SS type A sorting domain-containing protein [Ignavibacteriales bacterium]|nr:MAG: T9SS type A sorting domain-containing protein [Ignavibacteriales bacterium]